MSYIPFSPKANSSPLESCLKNSHCSRANRTRPRRVRFTQPQKRRVSLERKRLLGRKQRGRGGLNHLPQPHAGRARGGSSLRRGADTYLDERRRQHDTVDSAHRDGGALRGRTGKVKGLSIRETRRESTAVSN